MSRPAGCLPPIGCLCRRRQSAGNGSGFSAGERRRSWSFDEVTPDGAADDSGGCESDEGVVFSPVLAGYTCLERGTPLFNAGEAGAFFVKPPMRPVLAHSMPRQQVYQEDEKMRDIRLGVDGAQGTWHSISPAQRRALVAASQAKALVRESGSRHWFGSVGEPHAVARVCSLPTARNLIARELLAVDGGAFDPERRLVITERGRFVVKHGHTARHNP